jgi:predicted Fe-Mo cluster-binding NifX family protein
MKIAVSAMAPNLEAQVDPRFGRCQYFVVVDAETMQFEAIENSGAMASGGAGISTAQTIAGRGIQAVLTGNCGPNAFEVLSAAGIEVVTGVTGTVQDAVRAYKAGEYQASSQPNAATNSGAGG